MKKLLISVIIILLIVLTYMVAYKGITIGSLRLNSVKDIKNANGELEEEFSKSKELSAQTYPNAIDDLEKVEKELKIAKQQYEAKVGNNSEAASALNVIQVDRYNIEYLWTIIGNYATKNGVKIALDIKSTNAKDVYNLNFSVEGEYVGITDFIYRLEDDNELKFEINDFKMSSQKISNTTDNNTQVNENSTTQNNTNTTNTNTTNTNTTNKSTTGKNTKNNDGVVIYATFTVENVGINLNE